MATNAAPPLPQPEWWGRCLPELLPAAPAPPQAAIVTFSQAVDALLAGGAGAGGVVASGVPLGQLTEICGLAGAGKTQMALQLCLDVQIPAQLGGCGGGAVFLDAEGGLLPCRLAAMAAKVEEHMGKIMDKDPERYRAMAAGGGSSSSSSGGGGGGGGGGGSDSLRARVRATALLANVTYARITSLSGLTEAIQEGLPALLRQRAAASAAGSGSGEALLPIKLVVVDSLAFHFRVAGDLDAGERIRRQTLLGVALTRLAQVHECAVVVTNHLVTQRGGEGGWGEGAPAAAAATSAAAAAAPAAAAAATLTPQEALAAALDPDTSRLVPALGDAWAHFPSLRLHLKWDRGLRCAVLGKCMVAGGLGGAAGGGGGGVGEGGGNGANLLPPAFFSVQREGIRGLAAAKRPKKQ